MGVQQFGFYIGVLLLAHGFYLAFSHREVLQAHHHRGAGYVPMVDLSAGSAALSAQTIMIPIFLEVVVGMVVALFGFAGWKKLRPIRMKDHIRFVRYDQQQNTGMAFMHFNHRGTQASRGGAASETPAKTEEEKKKE